MKQQSIDSIENTANAILEKHPLATTPEGIAPSLLAHFNSMDVDVMLEFYEPSPLRLNPGCLLTKDFKKLLRNHYITLKKLADYADLLNVSVNNLNACVKAVTANSVSALIHREVIAESQRLLFYTNLDIKEIALDLGFEDQKYSSGLFRKVVGVGW